MSTVRGKEWSEDSPEASMLRGKGREGLSKETEEGPDWREVRRG